MSCPYVHDGGFGPCVLGDTSSDHRPFGLALEEPMHLCVRRVGGENLVPASKRFLARWARAEEGLAPCPRIGALRGLRCRRLDAFAQHEDGQHVGEFGNGTARWAVDGEDAVRWNLDGLTSRPLLPEPDPSLPRPPGWVDREGDYAFAFTGNRTSGLLSYPPSFVIARELQNYGREPAGLPLTVDLHDAIGQRVAWYRTRPLTVQGGRR